MKKNISLFILLLGLTGLNTGCTEEEPYVYNINEPAINFWIEPTNTNPRPVYPGDLEITYDFGSFANFVNRGYAAFSTVHTREIGVQIQGYPIDKDRKIALLADSIQSGDGVKITLDNDYIVKNGEATAKFSYSMEAIPANTSTVVVFTFDYNKTEFIPGLIERRYYTLKCTNSNSVPQNTSGFNINSTDLMLWGWATGALYTAYGKLGLMKLKFISLIYKSANLSALPTSTAAATFRTQLKTALDEYKALNAEDPVKYPPLYDDGSTTWIVFP